MNARPASTQRGLTFIEVVVATAVLAGLATMVLGTLSFMETASLRQKHRLNAAEVAHRVIAQFLDDPDKLPDKSLPIQQGEHLYRFILREEILVTEEGDARGLRRGAGRIANDLPAEEQLRNILARVTVQVYLDDPSAPIDTSAPMADLVRIYGTLSLADEDAIMKRLLKLVDLINTQRAGTGRSQPSNAPPRRP